MNIHIIELFVMNKSNYGKHKSNWGCINIVNSSHDFSYHLDEYGKLKKKYFPRNHSRNISRDYQQYFNQDQNKSLTPYNKTFETNSTSSNPNHGSDSDIFNFHKINDYDDIYNNENDYQFDDDYFYKEDFFYQFQKF